MKTKLKKTSKRKPAGRARALAVDAGSAFPTFAAGQVLEYTHGCKYRVEVAAQVGPIIFAHAIFTTGVVQREGHGIQSLDVRDLDMRVVDDIGKPWDNGYHPEPKRFSC